MTVMRRTEVVADNLYKQKLIRGFLHLYNGQEAIVAGYESVITWEDHIITAYRDHAHFLGRGGTPFQVFAELLGKQAGCSAGKGGSMHMYKADTHFHGGNGIVGAQVPVGAGVAFACKYNNNGKVCLSFYGDGAANQGQIFEAYNMAQLWKLPAIFICENNKYGMGTSVERASANTAYYTRGDVVPGLKIDAMNVLAVKEGMKFATEFARKTGPIVVEMETYRYMGHSMSDPGLTYRTRDEVNAIRAERDPIDRVKLYLLENNLSTEEELKEIEKEVRKEVDEAAKAAQEAPFPEPRELFTDIYTKNSRPYYVRHVELQNSVVID
jgi:pyruvate dehydrogenase E1 component alpha subunit